MSGSQLWWIIRCKHLVKSISHWGLKLICHVALDRKSDQSSLPALGHQKGFVVAIAREAVMPSTLMMLLTMYVVLHLSCHPFSPQGKLIILPVTAMKMLFYNSLVIWIQETYFLALSNFLNFFSFLEKQSRPYSFLFIFTDNLSYRVKPELSVYPFFPHRKHWRRLCSCSFVLGRIHARWL